MPVELIDEDTTNRGRIDLTLKLEELVYIIEFKLADNSNENSALQQIKERRYFEKYQDSGATIYLIGVEFDTEAKNIGRFDWELLS
jgi:hypothetical protein